MTSKRQHDVTLWAHLVVVKLLDIGLELLAYLPN